MRCSNLNNTANRNTILPPRPGSGVLPNEYGGRGPLPLAVKWSCRKADHSSPSNAKAKTVCVPIRLHGTVPNEAFDFALRAGIWLLHYERGHVAHPHSSVCKASGALGIFQQFHCFHLSTSLTSYVTKQRTNEQSNYPVDQSPSLVATSCSAIQWITRIL
jgi:hypothetical protein